MARRSLNRAQLARACLLFVGAAGVAMTVSQDGHGVGILAGAGSALFVLLRRRTFASRHPLGPLQRLTATVGGVWLLTTLAWAGWVRLRVELLIATPNVGDTPSVG